MFPTVDTGDFLHVTLKENKSSEFRDEPKTSDTANNLQIAKRHRRKKKIIMIIKEALFFGAILLTTYGALHNTSRVSKYPQPVRFFDTSSYVADWYRGQLTSALRLINKADVSFVMYYAPWDAECQHVKEEFEKAAFVLHDKVHFSAINCWSPGSECRLMHNKISSWPILIAYTVTTRGFFYRGPRDAHSMVKFLHLIMKPLVKISSSGELANLLSVCDLVAVGYTPLTETSKYYNVWYNVALKVREFDTIGEVCFGAVTSEELAFKLEVTNLPSARLMLWNDTKEFIVDDDNKDIEWVEQTLVNWVLENFTQPVARIIPMWKKAFSFERFVDGNPLLMLFTPLNPLYQQLPVYDLLREVAMEYYNCNSNVSNQWISELMKLQQMQRLLYQQKDLMKFCQNHKVKKTIRKIHNSNKVVSHNNKYPWNNSTYKNQKNVVLNSLKRGLDIAKDSRSGDNLQLMSSLELLRECSAKLLPADRSLYDNYGQCQSLNDNLYCEQDDDFYTENIETTMLPYEDDPLAPENLQQDTVTHFCKILRFANEWGPPVYPAKVNGNITHIKGLACEKNFTLNMVAVDSVVNHHFAESLGIDIRNKKDMTAVVILDSKHESQYVLSEEYSAKSVRDFIYNFTNQRLKRALRTRVDSAAHTHYFGSDGVTEQMAVDENTLHIIDLTTRTFKKVVNTPGMTTLVCVCLGACSARVTGAAAGATLMLRAAGVRAVAARLDAAAHDLPWHYTPHALPAILVFTPDSGEAGSVVYPAGARVSRDGLLALALRSLGTPRHLHLTLQLCRTSPVKAEKKTCLKDMKEHITTMIGRNLKYWRRTECPEIKQAIFKRLQHLHTISFNLSLMHIDELGENSEKNNNLINSLQKLSKGWHIDVSSPLRCNDTASINTRS